MTTKASTLNSAVDKSAIPDDTKIAIKSAVTAFYSASVYDAKRVTLRAKAERDRENILKKLAASEAATAKNRADLLESYDALLKLEASDEAVLAKTTKAAPAEGKEPKVVAEGKATAEAPKVAKVPKVKAPKEAKEAAAEGKEGKEAKEPKEPKEKKVKAPKAEADAEAAPKGVKRGRKPKTEEAEADPHTSKFAETEPAKPVKRVRVAKPKVAVVSSSDDSSDNETKTGL